WHRQDSSSRPAFFHRSSPRKRGPSPYLRDQPIVEVRPRRIHFFNHLQLPRAIPFLHLTLARERGVACLVLLIPDEICHPILLGEPWNNTGSVHPRTFDEVVGRTDVERSVSPARQDVNIESHRALPWVPAFAGTNGLGDFALLSTI